MGLLQVDLEACTRDGICVAVCPIGILVLDAEGGPRVREGSAPYCLACGHCVAACPTGALDHARNPLATQQPLPSSPILEADRAHLFLRSRRSIRCYQERPVPRDVLLRLLDIARYAPSGHNSQGISYLVVEGRSAVDSVSREVVAWMVQVIREQPEMAGRLHMPGIVKAWERGQDRILRHAPQLIVAHAPETNRAAPVSTMLALEYVELYAPTLGLGTCWAGFAQICAQQHQKLPELLTIPTGHGVTGMLMVGYPKFPYYRAPSRDPLDVKWFPS